MAGIRMICKIYGGLTVRANGETVTYRWDYERDKPVTLDELKRRQQAAKDRRKAEREARKAERDRQAEIF